MKILLVIFSSPTVVSPNAAACKKSPAAWLMGRATFFIQMVSAAGLGGRAVVLQPRFAHLFTAEEREIASRRLADYGHQVP